MTFLSWRKNYSVHIPLIDGEHRRLFDLINEFYDTGAIAESRTEALHVLNRLVAYAEEHFQHEEAMMGRSDYPRLDYHREQHVALFQSIFELNSKMASGTVKPDFETWRFLKHWLNDHILKDDMDFGDFILRKANQAVKAAEAGALKNSE